MFSYKFAPPSQPKNQTRLSAPAPLKGPDLDITPSRPSATLSDNSQKLFGFDGSISQPFASRRVDSHRLDASAHLYNDPEIMDRKPLVPAAGTSSRLNDAPIEAGLKSRAFNSPTPSLKEYSKRSVKAEPSPSPSDHDLGSQNFFTSMQAAFLDLQKEKSQMRDYIKDLESRITVEDEENTMLSRKFAQMETTHKQTMERNRDALFRAAKNFSALKSELDDLKVSSKSYSLIVSEVKATMENFAAFRDSTQSSLRELESMFDDGGRLVLTAESRHVINELRSELSKTQQVADLLRDKLHIMGTELAEARARNLDLEEITTTDKNRYESMTLKMRQSADQLADVTRYWQEQKEESIQARTKAYEMEQQLIHAQTRLQEAQSVTTSMKEEMTAREELLEEQGAKLRTLRHTIDFQEGNVRVIEARAQKAEEELIQALNHHHELQGRLDSAKDLEKHLTQQFLDKLKSFEEVKRDLDMYRDKYAEGQVSWKVLQERFDDQSVTLAASKESVAELQERLHAAERQATETLVESKREIIQVQEQNKSLKARLERVEKEMEDKTTLSQAVQIELSLKEGAVKALLETEKSAKNELSSRVQEANAKVESLRTELTQKDYEIQEISKRLAAAEAPAAKHEQEVAELRTRITELEEIEKTLTHRATTISHRYENNDLNDDERALIALLMQKARAVHDREMVEKANEIKRRDNIIKQQEARIKQLADVLARRISEEVGESTDEQSNSMAVDVTKPQAPSLDHQPEIRGPGHSDGPSTTVTHGGSDRATGDSSSSVSGPSSRSTGYATFTKLCREDTDDIASFDDEHATVATGKRVTFADDTEDGSWTSCSRPTRRAKHRKATGVDVVSSAFLDQPVGPASGTSAGTGCGTGTSSGTSVSVGIGNKKKAAPRRR